MSHPDGAGPASTHLVEHEIHHLLLAGHVHPSRGLVLRELAPGVTAEDVRAQTEPPVHLEGPVGSMV